MAGKWRLTESATQVKLASKDVVDSNLFNGWIYSGDIQAELTIEVDASQWEVVVLVVSIHPSLPPKTHSDAKSAWYANLRIGCHWLWPVLIEELRSLPPN
jgi:hypothetical protein